MAQYDFFDSKKLSLIGKYGHKVFHDKVFSFLDSDSKLDSKVILEIGTGKGDIAKRIIEKKGEYQGYEPSESLYKRLIDSGVNVQNKFVPPLSQGDDSVDVVLLLHVFEHMANMKQALELISEIKRVLKPGGKLLLVAPDFSDFGPWFYEGDYTHQFPVSLFKTKNMLEDVGLKVVEQKYIWGSWGWLPGAFLNQGVKMLFSLGSIFIDLVYPKNQKLLKLRCTFGRCIWIESEK